MAQDAIVLQDELHLLRPQLERQERPEVLRLCDDLFFHRQGEVFLQVIVEAVEISPLLLRDDWLAALVFGIEQRGQLGRDAGRGLVCRQGSGGNEDGAKDNEGRSHVVPASLGRDVMNQEARMIMIANPAETAPAIK